MTNYENGTNQVEDDYYGHYDDDDLDDFIVDSDDDGDATLKKQKQHQQEAEEEDEEIEEEEDDEEEEEEAPVGLQEILSLREQLKENIRRQNAEKAAGVEKAGYSSSVKQTMQPVKDRFGTFFGPSKPVLARRVIEEGCSSIMKEVQNVPSRRDGPLVSKALPSTSGNLQKPKFVSQEKRKVDTLRENRDYSSLFSDDTPSTTKEEQHDNRPALVTKSDVRVRASIHSGGKTSVPPGEPVRLSPKDQKLKSAAPTAQARLQSKTGSQEPLPERKKMIPIARNGSNLPMKRSPVLPSNGQKLQSPLQSKRSQAPLPVQRHQQLSQGQTTQRASQGQKLQSNGRQSLQIRRPNSCMHVQRPVKNGSGAPRDGLNSAQRQLASSNLKASRPVEKRAAKRKADEGKSVISSMIRNMFKYHPEEFAGKDEDISDMEADYASIQKEERRSAQLARKEDQEQLRLIEEEERRERAKKRKKSDQKQQSARD
ncbi:hypothetical protein ACP70R_026497 [Stipagrostis hirtigluma subsp. patula]